MRQTSKISGTGRVLSAVAMATWLAGAAGGFAAEPVQTSDGGRRPGTAARPPCWTATASGGTSRCRVAPCAHDRRQAGAVGPYAAFESRPRCWFGARPPSPRFRPSSSPLPPADWAGVEMDDGAWPRVRLPQPAEHGPAAGNPGRKRSIAPQRHCCLRGKFEVKDPAQVKTCRLGLDYLGGVVVYVNGKEVVRRHRARRQAGPPGAGRGLSRGGVHHGQRQVCVRRRGSNAPFGPELPDWSAAGPTSAAAGRRAPRSQPAGLRDSRRAAAAGRERAGHRGPYRAAPSGLRQGR